MYIEATARLMRAHRIDADDIASVLLVGSRVNSMLAEPLPRKQRPATATDAKFSVPFTVATVLRGSVELQLEDGRRVKLEIEQPSGSPRRPATDAALIAKFRDCCRRARSEPGAATMDAWANQIRTLETCVDAGNLARWL